MKLVISQRYGGFGLSDVAVKRYAEIKGLTLYPEESEFSSLMGPTYHLVPEDERVQELADWHSAPLEDRQIYNQKRREQVLYDRDIPRDDPALVQVVEELGEKASNRFSNLVVVEIPDDVQWKIEEYDGYEHVAEEHRTWG